MAAPILAAATQVAKRHVLEKAAKKAVSNLADGKRGKLKWVSAGSSLYPAP